MGLFRMKKSMPESLAWVLRIMLIVSIPVVLSLTNVRLLMTPLFPDVIYNLPGFPADYYGLTKADRLYWSKLSIQYILNDPAADDLADWKFADGVTAPPESAIHYTAERGPEHFYNEREVTHMVDVQVVTTGALQVWIASLIVAALAFAGLAYAGPAGALRGSLLLGTALTIVVYLGLVAYIAINFDSLFVYFHKLFFADGTWTFLWSDSLIRLFPIQFWVGAFTFVGVGGLVEAGLIALAAWRYAL
jgi:integral membrane protein (TIGR01906 family)